jgi:hypothetical protein
MDIKGFIDYIQEKQRIALESSQIEKFDVCIKKGHVSVWITVKKDRVSTPYFYDVVYNETTEDKINDIINKVEDICRK